MTTTQLQPHLTRLNFLQRLQYAQQLWAVVMPDIPQPPSQTFVGWLSRFTDNEVERALLQVPHRIRNWHSNTEFEIGQSVAVDPEGVYKLVTSFLSKAKGRNTNTTNIKGGL